MKKSRWAIAGAVAYIIFPGAGRAEVPGEALAWLQRVATSAEKLNYGGVFIYRSGNTVETSRITHFSDGTKERERLEVLDGSPREVVRENNETKCYLPESRLVVVERRSTRRSFPAAGLLPDGLASLGDYYVFRKGAISRLAGYEAQAIFADAKDDMRYSRQFWIENNTGLLLKAILLGDKGEPRESFAFTEVKIGGAIDKSALKGHSNVANGDWRVRDVKSVEAGRDDIPWVLRDPIPGFRQVSGMKRQISPEAPEVTHMVFSDGLAAISVFIEPLAVGKPRGDASAFSIGAVNGYRRNLSGFQLVAIGDVPSGTLKRLVDGIEVKHR